MIIRLAVAKVAGTLVGVGIATWLIFFVLIMWSSISFNQLIEQMLHTVWNYLWFS